MNQLLKYTMIGVLFLGYTSCKKTPGEKAEVSDAKEVAAAQGVDYQVNTTSSMVSWEGAKPTGTHTGTLSVSDGSVSVTDGKVSAGSFTLDMNSINVTDLEGGKKAGLESHLKGMKDDNADDFFNVRKHPTATFEITKVTNLLNDTEANHLIYGNLTLKGISKEIQFKAQIDVTDAMVNVSSPQFTIDRTLWEIKYGSPSFFEGLKDKAINNEIALSIALSASANPS